MELWIFYKKQRWKLENVPVSHGCPFASYGPSGDVSLVYHVYFAYEPKPRTLPKSVTHGQR